MTDRPMIRFLRGVGPVVLVWAVLVGWLAWLIADRARRSDESDRATLREWLDETRNFRKTLPELLREANRLQSVNADPDERRLKDEEIEEHLRALNEPLRTYPNQLPLFPEVYRIEIGYGGTPGPRYDSGLPRSRASQQTVIRELIYAPLAEAPQTFVRCEYRVHAVNKLQRLEEERRQQALLAEVILVAATVLAGLYVWRYIRAERLRLTALAEAEHRERELERDLLQKKLDAQELATRAAAAETAAADLKTQMFANIGIMAGSYAHNIKNLLVRPNDLLARCLEQDGLTGPQTGMLTEVRQTLGTVSDRLQQILATVRRDPAETADRWVDLNRLVREATSTWSAIARDKWKVTLVCQCEVGDVEVVGEESNLLQVVENLLFNARDATFEKRNALREAARTDPLADPATRRQKLIDAVGWVGTVTLRTFREETGAGFEVSDDGIGMTDETRNQCLAAHFTTKRDNALYEGHAAGMGLGLSFVAAVAKHHGAELSIRSQWQQGTTFRLTFPRTERGAS